MYRTHDEIMEAAAYGVTLGEMTEPMKAASSPPQGPQPPPPPPGPYPPTPPQVPEGWRRRVP